MRALAGGTTLAMLRSTGDGLQRGCLSKRSSESSKLSIMLTLLLETISEINVIDRNERSAIACDHNSTCTNRSAHSPPMLQCIGIGNTCTIYRYIGICIVANITVITVDHNDYHNDDHNDQSQMIQRPITTAGYTLASIHCMAHYMAIGLSDCGIVASSDPTPTPVLQKHKLIQHLSPFNTMHYFSCDY